MGITRDLSADSEGGFLGMRVTENASRLGLQAILNKGLRSTESLTKR